MVVQLIPFDTENKFKNIRKMAMVNSNIQEGGQLRTLQFPSSYAPVEDKKSFYKNTLVNTAIQSELSKPINEKIISHLSRDIIDILQDHELNDAQKASNYLQAIKRYLIYQGKLNNLTPVGSIEPMEGISRDEPFKPKINRMKQDKKRQRKDSDTSRSDVSLGDAAAGASPHNSNGSFEWDKNYNDDQNYDERQFQKNKIIHSFRADKSDKVGTMINSICDNVPIDKLNWNIPNNELIIDNKKFENGDIKKLMHNLFQKKPKKTLYGFQEFIDVLRYYDVINEHKYKTCALIKRKKSNVKPKSNIENWND